MESVDQLFNGSPYHTYSHNQSHVYPFYSSQTHHQPSAADPSRHSSPAPGALPPSSSHGLFLPQPSVAEPPTSQDQPTETTVDQIQDDTPIDEEPLYVNAKQYYRILKRRVARARLEEVHRLSRQRKPYLHESRHKHAMRRPRGPGGRFLTSEEIAAQKTSQTLVEEPSASNSQDGEDDEDHDLERHGEISMSSPVDHPTSQSMAELPRDEALGAPQMQQVRAPAIQPLLQPRPQIQIQTMQPLQKSDQQLSHSLQPQSAPAHLPVQSPFGEHVPMPHSAGALDMLSASFMPQSHPPTPTALSPHSAMPDVMSPPERMHDHHAGHGHSHVHPHPRAHDHQRHMSTTSTVTVSSSQPSPTASTPGSTIAGVRNTYAAMQMHHVPHPHAHARHHTSYLNRAERLYAPTTGQGAMNNMRFDNASDRQ
ncbi:CCAAT-binding transcription factor (CBF-B/NF-YA) subunit B-domain-containing protein [Phanerochaete sordida]|uniref:Transcriptional activator HAP2 n=1 Tax=Phanerochaete sordida TaxID=48140 RepID=A0A9P3GH75_9APHY|nr:CCAAT-binding transcription factor (CBF-B/NF-YA) subunit B-domain-containing protein [Phanerochaete sordida]